MTTEKILMTIYYFYSEKLKEEDREKAFKGYKSWMKDVLHYYDNNINLIKNYDVFTDDPPATFEGLEKVKNKKNKYVVILGPL